MMYRSLNLIISKRSHFYVVSLMVLTFVAAISCSSDEDGNEPVREEAPIVTASEAGDVGRTVATLKGSITRGFGYTIFEQGFVFLGSQTAPDSIVVSFYRYNTDDISHVIDHLDGNTTYRYRTYAIVAPHSNPENRSHLFSSDMQFTTAPATFSAESFWPVDGAPGAIISIYGSNYGTEAAEVNFGGVNAEIVERTTGTLKFKVPEGLDESLIEVSVTIAGTTVVVPTAFNLHIGSWERLSDAPMAAPGKFNFTIGDEVFIGFDSDGAFYSFKPGTGDWTERENAPLNVMCAFALFDSQGYVITDENKVYVYTPAGGWLQLNNFPGVARRSAFGFTVNNTAYAGAGRTTDHTPLHDFWEYDAAEDSWTRKNDFPGTFDMQAGSSYGLSADGKAYVFNKPELWVYLPASDSWEQKESFPLFNTTAYNPRGFVLDDKLYLGGLHGYVTFYVYQSENDQWLRVSNIPLGAEGLPFTFSFNGKGYLGCGRGALNLPGSKVVWTFTP